MRKLPLGRTGLEVSELCLGSMTWGKRNTTAEGHAQIDMALDHGVNFIDTAEMYPTNPVLAENCGKTEEVIGDWFASSGRREDVVLATKITGGSAGRDFIRNGADICAETLPEAVEGSLRRLKTDYIDLYQFHWPNRGSYMFRQNWVFDPSAQNPAETRTHMESTLEALQKLVDQGKIRHFGLSNESCWGTSEFLRIAEARGLPRVASMQNEYSLLCRLYDTDMAEMSVNEDVTLLAFSPLATGLLSGKYEQDVTPIGSRRTENPDLGGRITPRVWPAIAAYQDIAERHGLSLVQMSLAWLQTRPFAVSTIFGATDLDQLALALGSADITLSTDILKEIAEAHKQHPMPY